MEYKKQFDVASSELGTKVVYCSDEFFADSGSMLQSSEPVNGLKINMMKMVNGWMVGRAEDVAVMEKMIFVLSDLDFNLYY